MLDIDRQSARRFVLGKQGLWPGRRWDGPSGPVQAMREIEYLQLDPLQIMARSHEIQLHSRVLDYQIGSWETATYVDRQFFDWGGWLATRPMDELPYWRTVMQRELRGDRDCDPRVRKNREKYAEIIDEMGKILIEQTTVSNRGFEMADRVRTNAYRGRKDSALALYNMWRAGEVMTHHREKFERVYALADQVAPPALLEHADEDATDRFLFLKEIRFGGLSPLKRTSDAFQRGIPFSRKREILDSLLADDEIVEVKLEGQRATHYMVREDLDLLNAVIDGRVPDRWTSIGPTTEEEAVFLSPLDPVSARGRAKTLFGFDYVWEVYKPVDKRKYGYYVLPILWGDQLVGRFDGKLDRESNRFEVLGFWLEDRQLESDPRFVDALTAGFARFGAFLGARQMTADPVQGPRLREQILDRFGKG